MANDAFFLGGIDKGKVLGVLRPHIFFDDQMDHLVSASKVVAAVHIPFGIANAPTVTGSAPVAPKRVRKSPADKRMQKGRGAAKQP